MSVRQFEVVVTPIHRRVTGSCFYVKVQIPPRTEYSFIVDCGLFQGHDYELNGNPFPRCMKAANRLFLTHNHVDHVGRVPQLVRNGFKGKIHCSPITAKILRYSWGDCLKIEKGNAKWENREPRFKMNHVTKALDLVIPYAYYNRKEIYPGIWTTFLPNAHTLGAAMLLVEVQNPKDGEPSINILFSGDYNYRNYFFDVDDVPEQVKKMPLHLICESTYGATNPPYTRTKVFENNIEYEVMNGKQILVPVFAFERGQIVLSILKKMQEAGKLNKNIPIYVDGALLKNYNTFYQEIAQKYFKDGMKNIIPGNCHDITPKFDKRELLQSRKPYLLVTSGGMATNGPVVNYLKNFVLNPNGVIHFAGFQCEGTIGQRLQSANEEGSLVEVFGNLLRVKCRIYYTNEFSSHATPPELLAFICKFKNLVSVSLNHGTEEARFELAKMILKTGIVDEVGNLLRGGQYHFTSEYMETKIIQHIF